MSNIEGVKEGWKIILQKSQMAENIVLIGVSTGTDVQAFLCENGMTASEYFDNSDLYVGSNVNGIKVVKPYKVLNLNTLYIISSRNEKSKKELTEQLTALEIDVDDIVYVPIYDNRKEKLANMTDEAILSELSNIYTERIGKIPNFDNPLTYTEKMNANKINMCNGKCTLLSDKYLVKDYIKKEIGEQYVVPLLGVWDNAEEINYDELPDQFVLKINNASGRNIIVKNKAEINIQEVNKRLNDWLDGSHVYLGYELQYKNIKPKIICEEYLDGLAENIYDYQFFCFHGEPKFIWCIKGSHRFGCRASFYNLNWEMQPFSFGYPKDDEIVPRPSKLNEMLELSRKLSKGYDHVRVDLYEMPDGRVLFGEMTFQTWAGLRNFYPPMYDRLMGDYL